MQRFITSAVYRRLMSFVAVCRRPPSFAAVLRRPNLRAARPMAAVSAAVAPLGAGASLPDMAPPRERENPDNRVRNQHRIERPRE